MGGAEDETDKHRRAPYLVPRCTVYVYGHSMAENVKVAVRVRPFISFFDNVVAS